MSDCSPRPARSEVVMDRKSADVPRNESKRTIKKKKLNIKAKWLKSDSNYIFHNSRYESMYLCLDMSRKCQGVSYDLVFALQQYTIHRLKIFT